MPYVTRKAYDLNFKYAMAEADILTRQFCESCGYTDADDVDYMAQQVKDAVARALPSPTVGESDDRPPDAASDKDTAQGGPSS